MGAGGMFPRHAERLAHSIHGTRSGENTDHSGGQFEECVVHHTDSTGLYFTRPMFDKNKTIYGPAPYAWPGVGVTGATAVSTFGTHTHTTPVPTTSPIAGDKVLIVWAVMAMGGFRPWVIGWSAT